MDTNGIGSAAGAAAQQAQGAGQTQPGGNAFANLNSQEFMNVLLTELKNQDPMKPQDTGKLLEQLSSLRNIESQTSLQNQLQSLVTQNQLAGAGNLIGKQVTGLTQDNQQISGLVSSVRVQDDSVVLELDNGRRLPMDRVTGIAEPSGGAAAGG